MMSAVQFTCAKIGMVSGTGLAAVLRERFPRQLVYAAVFALVGALVAIFGLPRASAGELLPRATAEHAAI